MLLKQFPLDGVQFFSCVAHRFSATLFSERGLSALVGVPDGYTKRFGIVYVDYKNGLLRHLKASAKYLAALFSPEPLASPTASDSAAENDVERH